MIFGDAFSERGWRLAPLKGCKVWWRLKPCENLGQVNHWRLTLHEALNDEGKLGYIVRGFRFGRTRIFAGYFGQKHSYPTVFGRGVLPLTELWNVVVYTASRKIRLRESRESVSKK